MKKITTPVWIRAVIATALCLSFVVYPQLRLASVQAAARAAADLKSESQFRSEAARYDGAIRAISGIATMKLETGEDLKKAIAILDRERPNLKFVRSKLIVLGLSDSTFSSAVKKKLPDKQAAEAFAKELKADRKAVLKLDGATSLASRMRRSAESDAAVMRRAGERLKEAAERIQKAGQRSAVPGAVAEGGLMLVRAGFSAAAQPTASLETLMMTPQGGPGEVVMTIALIVFVVVVIPGWGIIIGKYLGIGEKEDQDQVAECQVKADDGYSTCVSAASDLPSGFPFFQREAATALCYGDWLINQAACLTLYV